MYKKLFRISVFILLISTLISSSIVVAKSNTIIVFKDQNLQNALGKCFDYKGAFSKETAAELSEKNHDLDLENSNISDLEGVQYFNKTAYGFLDGNDLINLKPLSELKNLIQLFISDNSVKGKKFEQALMEMGRIEKLSNLTMDNNGITNINFLGNIGNLQNYKCIEMENNKIVDISILKGAINLESLDLSNNRIKDVSSLKNLKKLSNFLDLQDNCIIDYKPIKPLLDEMYDNIDYVFPRYDYYTNPVNFTYNGKKIDFAYLTAYYKEQGYAEAIPLFKALGGSAKYDKKTGILTCKYAGTVLVFKDFSKKYTINGEKMSLKYPMRRMQYDLAYVPVKDVCEVLGLEYNIVKKRVIYQYEDIIEYAPKLVEIRKAEKELG